MKRRATRLLAASAAAAVVVVFAGAGAGAAHAANSTWTLNGNGDWGNAGNWSNGVPNGIDDSATFGSAITGPRAVNQNVLAGVTLGGIAFNSAHAYTINGNPITMNVSAGPGAVTVFQGAHTINANLTLADPFVVTGNAGATLTLANIVSGSGGLTKNGGMTLTLAGIQSNIYNGNTTVNQGTLRLAKTTGTGVPNGTLTIGDGSAPAGPATAFVVLEQGSAFASGTAILINANGQLDGGDRFNLVQAGLTMTGAQIVNANLRIINGDVTTTVASIPSRIEGAIGIDFFGQNRTFNVADGTATDDLVITSPITGTGGFSKAGGGTMVLGGGAGNTFTGFSAVNEGTVILDKTAGNAIGGSIQIGNGGGVDVVRLNRPNQIADTATVFVNTGGNLALNGQADTIGALSLSGGLAGVSGAGALTVKGNITSSGNATRMTIGAQLTLDAATATIAVDDGDDSIDLVINGAIDGGGAGGANTVVKSGAGTLQYGSSPSNSYSGTTAVHDGMLILNKPAAAPIAIAGRLVVGDGAGGEASDVVQIRGPSEQILDTAAVAVRSSGLLDLNNHTETIGSLEMTGGEVRTGPDGTLILLGGVTANADTHAATLAGTVSLGGAARTFAVADGADPIDLEVDGVVTFGGVTKTGAGAMRMSGNNNYTGPTTVAGGTLRLEQSLTTSSSISVADGAAAVLAAGGTKMLRTAALAVTGSGALDLGDNKLIVDGGTLGTSNGTTYTGLTRLIQTAYQESAWTGAGITTSMPAATTGLTTLAIATAEQVGVNSFGGFSVSGDDVLVMYTYGGDTNFDGKLDADDYGTIDFSVLLPGVVDGYYNGDFNYDGIVNADDYGVIDFNILAQTTPFPTSGGATMTGVTAVPEPGVAGIMFLATIGRVLRRRRR